MDEVGRTIAGHDVVRRDSMAPGKARAKIVGVGRRIVCDKRGRVMVCGERLGWRTQWIKAGAEIQHAARRVAAVSSVDREFHRASFIAWGPSCVVHRMSAA